MENGTKNVYTAEEMKMAAKTIGCYDLSGTVAAMLIQAAEMNERCVKIRDKYMPYYGQNDGEVDAIIDTVDYVQTGKEN